MGFHSFAGGVNIIAIGSPGYMNKFLLLCLGAAAVLVTGCPRDEYIVELTPRGNVIERKLIFYREDGTNTNGSPNYRSFPSNELAAITAIYLPGQIKSEGEQHIATGTVAGVMPADIGGTGWYTNLISSLGSAGFYSERFRGNDDIAAMTEKRFRAADELTDLIIGWSGAELGREPNYPRLRRFLDVNFRHDLRNLGSYLGPMREFHSARRTGISEEQTWEECTVRFGQYLVERGYVKISNLPDLLRVIMMNDDKDWGRLIQELAAEKLGVPESRPYPDSLAVLTDPDVLVKSWEKHLVTTKFYRTRIKEWEQKRKTNPQLEKPKPSEVSGQLLWEAIGLDFKLFGDPDDHLVVKLALPSPPVNSNGRWDETNRQVLWEADLEERAGTNRVPTLCYASWSQPDERFQRQHFGRVLLDGEDLLRFSLWRGGLDKKQAGEWEAFLADLHAGEKPDEKLEAFRFSDEPLQPPSDSQQQRHTPSAFPRELIHAALQKPPPAGAP